MRRFAGWLLALLVFSAAGPAGGSAPDAASFPIDAVGRLIADGDRHCTAFIVRSLPLRNAVPYGRPQISYEHWIASAGHCNGGSLVFQVAGHRYPIKRVIGFSGGESRGFDVLIAAFSTDGPLPALEPAFGTYPELGDPLMLIGYGRNALMVRVDPLLGYDPRGHMEIGGYASPGNSGGPVLIPGTRLVVGIGIESALDRPAGAPPMHCLIAGCAVKPPYVATHIDRLKGIASFR